MPEFSGKCDTDAQSLDRTKYSRQASWCCSISLGCSKSHQKREYDKRIHTLQDAVLVLRYVDVEWKLDQREFECRNRLIPLPPGTAVMFK